MGLIINNSKITIIGIAERVEKALLNLKNEQYMFEQIAKELSSVKMSKIGKNDKRSNCKIIEYENKECLEFTSDFIDDTLIWQTDILDDWMYLSSNIGEDYGFEDGAEIVERLHQVSKGLDIIIFCELLIWDSINDSKDGYCCLISSEDEWLTDDTPSMDYHLYGFEYWYEYAE